MSVRKNTNVVQCCFCPMVGPFSVITEHINTEHSNEESLSVSSKPSSSTIPADPAALKGIWSNAESKYLLEKYEEYIGQVGPVGVGRFKSKTEVWKKIAQEIRLIFNTIKSYSQLEQRCKTMIKRKQKQMEKDSSTDDESDIEEFDKEVGPFKRNKKLKSEGIIDVLLELHDKKEQASERRHREKMDMLKEFCGNRS